MHQRQYYAVFTPPARLHWWSKILNRNIGHVLAIITDGPDAVVVERHRHCVEVLLYPKHSVQDVLSALRTQAPLIALHVESFPNRYSKVRYYALFNCVSQVKAMLGLSSWHVTPYQLYRYLLKQPNTYEVFPNGKYVLPQSPEGTGN